MMSRLEFTANSLKPSPIPIGTKCFVCFQAMIAKLKPEDMDTKQPNRFGWSSAYGCADTIYSNNGIVKAYNALRDEYKVFMYELSNPKGHRTIWVKSEDLDFATN